MAFIRNKHNELIYMQSELLPAVHAFSTRFGGVSEGSLSSLNFGMNRGDRFENVVENYRRFGELFGVGANGFAVTHQVHRNDVRLVTSADKHVWGTDIPYEADGVVTAEKGLPIICFAADCIPVLMCDTEKKAAAAVHCGWRSSVSDILGNAVTEMEKLGAKRENIHAAIGPAIGFCCFETDDDVPEAVEKYLGGDTDGLFLRRPDGKTMVDLRGANRRRLIQLGLKAENIDVSDECTYCSHDKYWSHRYTRGQGRGSQGAAIML